MRAIVITEHGRPNVLQIREVQHPVDNLELEAGRTVPAVVRRAA